ncbi:MAG: metalloregulator ArsR/SmtB family transcription factor [Oscillospiraceae bacterium]|nr:metalloregulator ArsR/SmtB family transcription factor [Oscillospiraceae bacterium]
MNKDYTKNTAILKAFADTNRLLIIEMLSCGEICACKILEKLKITQPTLSHHMKILCDCGLAGGRKEGKWTYYTLNKSTVDDLLLFMRDITTISEDCICGEVSDSELCEC